MTGTNGKFAMSKRAVAESVVHKLCAASDPFCSHADGSVQPGGTGEYTVPITFRGTQPVTTDANGNAFVVMRASNSNNSVGIYSQSTLNANTFGTVTGAFPAFVSDVRVVSAGLQWMDISPATGAGGIVQVSEVSDLQDILDLGAHTPAEIATAYPTVFTDRRKPGVFVFRPRNYANYEEFAPTNTSAGYASTNEPFNNACLYITGAASTQVLQVQWVIHYECTIDIDGATGFGRRRAEDSLAKRFLQTVMDKDSYIGGTTHAVGKYLLGQARGWAGRAIAGYLGGPVGVGAHALLTNGIPQVN